MILTEAYERTLDSKHRFQLPLDFRNRLETDGAGTPFYVCPGERANMLAFYPINEFEKLVRSLKTRSIASDEALAFEQFFFSMTSRLRMDPQGRVVLPERQLTVFNMGKDITLAGANDRIDIWRTTDYHEFVKSGAAEHWPKGRRFLRVPTSSEWEEKASSAVV
ncbi:MAG: hypothetical protein V2A79_16450 [Planctomycetota bacterium]